MMPADSVQKPFLVRSPRILIDAFDSLVSAAERRREDLTTESRTLASLRDTLLPKLISGELRVGVQ